MSKSFVFNMGYDTSHVTSVLAKEGVGEGSRVLLLTPGEMDERQTNSVEDINNYVSSLDFNVSLEKYPVSQDFQARFFEFRELLQDLENIVLSLSGGSRDFLVPLSIVSTIENDNIEKVFFRSDIDSKVESIDLPSLPNQISSSQKEVLGLLDSNPVSVKEILSKTGKSESSLYRTLGKLEDKKLVESEKDSGRKKYCLTFSGKVSLT